MYYKLNKYEFLIVKRKCHKLRATESKRKRIEILEPDASKSRVFDLDKTSLRRKNLTQLLTRFI